jgi:hypothetical protein
VLSLLAAERSARCCFAVEELQVQQISDYIPDIVAGGSSPLPPRSGSSASMSRSPPPDFGPFRRERRDAEVLKPDHAPPGVGSLAGYAPIEEEGSSRGHVPCVASKGCSRWRPSRGGADRGAGNASKDWTFDGLLRRPDRKGDRRIHAMSQMRVTTFVSTWCDTRLCHPGVTRSAEQAVFAATPTTATPSARAPRPPSRGRRRAGLRVPPADPPPGCRADPCRCRR